jgi:solute:Na+ symporter, SSS family
MLLAPLDWLIILAFILFSIGIAIYFRKQAENGLSGFFLGGRSLPWYLAGLSMVATTFGADTPLAVTELVASGGIAKNWLWWNLLAGGLLTTIFFSRLWRRANILTEVEFIDLRYSGKAAKFLRGFKAVYLGLFINAMIIAWVNQAFIAIIRVFFEIDQHSVITLFNVEISTLYTITTAAMILVMLYSSISGLKGIAVTDAFQFIIAMTGCIILAVIVVQSEKIGGIQGLKEKAPEGSLSFFPSFTKVDGLRVFTLPIITFFTYVGVLWWSSWYPGAEPGGGGYVAQRMMGAKTEKDSIYATLFFQIAHYCIRPWPWIIVALCTVVLYPELGPDDQKLGYVMAMRDFLPTGLKGLLLVAFLGAYMSTISTQLNWGASYLVNDLYKPFIRPEKSFADSKSTNKNYILISRLCTFLIMIYALFITTQITTITGVWEFIFQCGAGLGLVLILRWYWYRINVWSEITATIIPFFVYGMVMFKRQVYLKLLPVDFSRDQIQELTDQIWYFDFAYTVLLTVAITTVVWVAVTYMTAPTDTNTLSNFFNNVKPSGFWGKYGQSDNSKMPYLLLSWVMAVIMVYAALFGLGKLIFQEWNALAIYAVSCILSAIVFKYAAKKGELFV